MMDEQTRLEIEIARYVDGEMTPDERAAMARRLETEPGLRRIAEELTALRPHLAAALGSAAGSIEGERVWRNVADRIAARPTPFEAFRDGLRTFLRPRLALAAAALVLVVGLFITINAVFFHGATAVAAGPMVSEVEYADDPNVVVVVEEGKDTGVAVVWIHGIDASEVN
jgi:anti-sigma factor RsiW